MATRTTVYCDIKDCGKDAVHKQKTVSVRFLTETTEGRSTTPYLSGEKLDMCEEHYQQYIDSLPLTGSGAQGHNTYIFGLKET
jgi:hypothetical protein